MDNARQWLESELLAKRGVGLLLAPFEVGPDKETLRLLGDISAVDKADILHEIAQCTQRKIRIMARPLFGGETSMLYDPVVYRSEAARAYNNINGIRRSLIFDFIDVGGFRGFYDLFPIPPHQRAGTPKSDFRGLIQYEDKEKLLKRLHSLIDGNKGKRVGLVLNRAYFDKLITAIPTQGEFKSEFELIGTWQGIYKYTSQHENDIADIVIF